MGFDWLVTVVLGLHFAYVAYVVLGGFLAWRWPKAVWAHLVACVWAVLIVGGWVDCPLTWAEDWARQKAGRGILTEGFVDRYLDNVIYPDKYVNLARFAVDVVVLGSWVGAYLRQRRRRRRGAAQPSAPANPGTKSAEETGRAAVV